MIHWLCTWLGWHGIHIPRMQDWYHLFSDLTEGKKERMKENGKSKNKRTKKERNHICGGGSTNHCPDISACKS